MPSRKNHNRQSIRLRDYDYSSPGEYFITICTQNRECLFGQVVDGQMVLNDFGEIANKEWLQTEIIRDNVELDVFVIIPNHMHAIFGITAKIEKSGQSMVGAYSDTPLR
jgi:REP element-mobilizing transposase RayT